MGTQTFANQVAGRPGSGEAVYLDCNATTPVDPAVREVVERYLFDDYGNAGSRTHEYGARANRAVQQAREHVARVVDAQREDVVFTSGATEANNLAILGLAPFGEREGRRHIVSTQIEHKAVLEPLAALSSRGFEVTLVPPTPGGWVDPAAIVGAVRDNTLLVSVMHVNNETGVIQPIAEIAERLDTHPAFIHTDTAQGFGKDIEQLRHHRLDLLTISGHKVFAPKGVGALILPKRERRRPPLEPLMHGGGQERGLRPGTIPVHLVAGLGTAASSALANRGDREAHCRRFRERMLNALATFNPVVNGDTDRLLGNAINISFPGLDSEAIMLALRGVVAISNGSACTSSSYEPSHVLQAMGLPNDRVDTALRWSWCHMTEDPPWDRIIDQIRSLG